MSDQPKHIIEITDAADDDRSYWECDCGPSGSAPSLNVSFAAEEHVPDGERVSYRHPAGGGRW